MSAITNTTLPNGTIPDISYIPDREKWLKRTAKRLADDPTLLSTPLPEGFPQKLESPLVWEGKDYKDDSQWVYDLSPAELKEIDEAVHHFHGTLTCYFVTAMIMLIFIRIACPFRPYIS